MFLSALTVIETPMARLNSRAVDLVTAEAIFKDPRMRGSAPLHNCNLVLYIYASPLLLLRALDHSAHIDTHLLLFYRLLKSSQWLGRLNVNGVRFF